MDERQETVERLQPAAPASPEARVPWYRRDWMPNARQTACLLIPLGLFGLWWNWHHAHVAGEYYPKVAFMAPFVVITGLFYLAYPDEDPTKFPKPFRLRHWLMYAIGLAAGGANWYAFEHALY